jgi:DNA polymerase
MSSNHLYIDFETYSEVDIKVVGGYNYTTHPSTQIICFSHGLDMGDVGLWTPAKGDLPSYVYDALEQGLWFTAHNATFDWRIWHYIGHKQLGWPRIPLAQVLDTQALCQTYTLPGKLDDAGMALGVVNKKSKKGAALINKLCKPNKQGEQPHPWDHRYAKDFREFFQYCIDDTKSMREIVQTLPRQELIPIEQRIWEMTYRMNTRGLPVAYDEVCSILDYVTAYIEQESKKIPELVHGAFEKITQVAKVQEWCNTQGYPMDNLQAATVERAINDPDCPDNVKKILQLRQELGRTSTAKFKKIKDLAGKVGEDYYVYDNLVFHGAAPGRWTGRGFQMHNLPRLKVKDPDSVILDFMEGRNVDDPVGKAKALIRPIIKTRVDESLIVSDYSSIEYILLVWVAGDLRAVRLFADGYDQYVDMASSRYNRTYEEIWEGYLNGDPTASGQRQMGKVIILGCGYGMGWETFIDTAREQFGMLITEEDARIGITAYRTRYYLVKLLWDELKKAAIRAVLTDEPQQYGLIKFGTFRKNGIRWLAMRLPSGKSIYYCRPTIEDHYIPKYEDMGPVPTITHWGVNPYSKKWSRLKLIPGRITENAIQGTAREVMAQGLLNIQDKMPEAKLIGTVHDEALAKIKDKFITDSTLSTFDSLLCDIPWAQECPIKAKGYIAKRYKKD